jgi:hypothetical protein
MKAWSLLLAVLAVAAIVGLLALTSPYHIPLLEVFEFSSILVKMFCALLLVVGIVVLVAGVVQLSKGRAPASPFLWMMCVLVPLASLPPVAYGLLVMKVAIDRSHTTNLAVVAPGLVELLMTLALGLTIGAFAGLSNFRSRPAKRS